MAENGAGPAAWYADPFGRFDLRYWDGSTWTDHVSNRGVASSDPPIPTVTPRRTEQRRPSSRRWIAVGAVVAAAVVVVAVVASRSDDSSESGGATFRMKIADQAILETDDYPGLSRLGDADSSGGLCDEASAALQHVFGLVASWSPALQDAWKSPEQNFEQALTACRAGDGAAMVRAYRQAESSLPHFRDVLANLDCHLDPDDSSSLICR